MLVCMCWHVHIYICCPHTFRYVHAQIIPNIVHVNGHQKGSEVLLVGHSHGWPWQVLAPSRISGFMRGRPARAEYFFNAAKDMYGHLTAGGSTLDRPKKETQRW